MGTEGGGAVSAIACSGGEDWFDEWVHEIHFQEIDSTQSFVEREYEGFDQSKLTAVSAELQTAGRGTRDRRWESATPWCSVLVTFFFRFPKECETAFVNRNAPNATKLLALATLDTLRSAAEESASPGAAPTFGVKWPNDVVAGGGKIAGILARGVMSPGGRLDGIIIGVGANVNQPREQMEAIARPVWPATSLRALLSGAAVAESEDVPIFDINALRRQLVRTFARELRGYFEGGFPVIRERINELEVLMGTEVRFRVSDTQELDGIFAGVDDDGLIMLRLPGGEEKSFPSGEIIPRSKV